MIMSIVSPFIIFIPVRRIVVSIHAVGTLPPPLIEELLACHHH
jgi:hypothetical protein